MDDAEAASVQGSAQGSSIKSELADPAEEPTQVIPLPPSVPSPAGVSPRRSLTLAAPKPPPTPQSPPKYAIPSPSEISDKDYRSLKSQSPKYAIPSPTNMPVKEHSSPKYAIPSPTKMSVEEGRSPKSQSPKYAIPSPTKMPVEERRSPKSQSPKYAIPSPTKMPIEEHRSPKSQSPKYAIPSPTKMPVEERRSPKSQSPKYAIPSPAKMPIEEHRSPKSQSPKYEVLSPTEMPDKENKSLKSQRRTSGHLRSKIVDAVFELQPNEKTITEKVEGLKDTVKNLAGEIVGSKSNNLTTNIDKIATMSKALTCEANALRQSIKCLTEDIARTKQELLCVCKEEDVNFPYHLFLIEMIINKIHMKCECFDIDYNNLVISAVFLGKPPIVLYDSSFGKIENFSKLNIGKSTLFAMTYDKICGIEEFVIVLLLTKQPPCSTCVTRIAETHMDFTSEFIKLREELCKKWMEEQPTDNILCTTSTPLSKNMYYLSCCDGENRDSIGVIEVTVRMSFLGKEITTAFCASPKPQGTSFLLKEDHGMTMYSCHKVEMDDQGKILLDEGVMTKKAPMCTADQHKRSESPQSQSTALSRRSYDYAPEPSYEKDRTQKYDEIYTKMNVNELKIRVPKSSRVERTGRYDKIQELCSCESTAYNTGEQIQFELPRDPLSTCRDNTYTSNLTYTMQGQDRPADKKDRKTINVTPTRCPVPVNMEKVLHPQKDVFILKIGKKLETKDKKTDLEIELVTPKAPPCDKPLESINTAQQYSGGDISKLKAGTKLKGGKDKKAKGGKVKGKKGKKGKNK